VTEETKTEETKSEEKSDDDKPETSEAKPEPKIEEPKVAAKPIRKPAARSGAGWRPSWYRVGMGDLFIGIALLIAGTVVAMRTPTRWYGAFIVGTIETVHGLYLLSKKKQS
jgi:hypothetical protein